MLALVEACMCTNVRKLSRIITRLYDKYLKPSGININQLGILLTVQGLQDSLGNSPTVSEVADRMVMESSTLSRAIAVLMQNELVELEENELNRTQKHVITTELGKKKILEAYSYWNEIQEQIRDDLGKEKFDNMIFLLTQLEDLIRTKKYDENLTS